MKIRISKVNSGINFTYITTKKLNKIVVDQALVDAFWWYKNEVYAKLIEFNLSGTEWFRALQRRAPSRQLDLEPWGFAKFCHSIDNLCDDCKNSAGFVMENSGSVPTPKRTLALVAYQWPLQMHTAKDGYNEFWIEKEF